MEQEIGLVVSSIALKSVPASSQPKMVIVLLFPTTLATGLPSTTTTVGTVGAGVATSDTVGSGVGFVVGDRLGSWVGSGVGRGVGLFDGYVIENTQLVGDQK
jgi:hypothetical protein